LLILSTFFFSSRRRRTSFSRDWSSDVALPISTVVWPTRPYPSPTSCHPERSRGGESRPGGSLRVEGSRVRSTIQRKDPSLRCPRSEERRVGKGCWCCE